MEKKRISYIIINKISLHNAFLIIIPEHTSTCRLNQYTFYENSKIIFTGR